MAPRRSAARVLTLSLFGLFLAVLLGAPFETIVPTLTGQSPATGRELFERETFGGNGRTCRTCHSTGTGTVSPEDAQERFAEDPSDPLFVGDGSDDGAGSGVTRMLTSATIRMRIPLAPNVTLLDDPEARFVVVNRGIPTTLNTPALDQVLMLDGRQPDLASQALGAIAEHAQPTRMPTSDELQRIVQFERSRTFFSSNALAQFAATGIPPALPAGQTAAEKRGRHFFEDLAASPADPKAGICANCHSGPMLNQSNDFFFIVDPLHPELGLQKVPPGERFFSVLVSEFNAAGNPVHRFAFSDPNNPSAPPVEIVSPDPGRALITGNSGDVVRSVNAFKTPTLWGAGQTAPYFHDNSAPTLEEVMRHYATFFAVVTNGAVILTEQDQADAVAFMKLLR